jgi:hypothetical protein
MKILTKKMKAEEPMHRHTYLMCSTACMKHGGKCTVHIVNTVNTVEDGKNPVLVFLNNLWWTRNRFGKGLSYRLARLAELIPWNQFLGP